MVPTLLGFLSELNALIYVKLLEQSLAYEKHYMSFNYFNVFIFAKHWKLQLI